MNKSALLAVVVAMTTAGLCSAFAQILHAPPHSQIGPPPNFAGTPVMPPGSLCVADNSSNTPLPLVGVVTVDLTKHDLNGAESWSRFQSNDRCQTTCRNAGFGFSGTQSGGYCFCGSRVGGASAPNACTTRCLGNSSQACGGPNANTVMATTGSNLPAAGTQMPVAPPGGAQCVIDASNGTTYRYFEVDTWSPNGPQTVSGRTRTIPLNWTLSGGGFLDDIRNATASNGMTHTQENMHTWRLDMRAKTATVGSFSWIVSHNASGGFIWGNVAQQGVGGQHETQMQYYDGVFQGPSTASDSDHKEYALQSQTVTWAAPPPHTFTDMLDDSHHTDIAPWQSGASGTIRCVSNVP